MYSAIYARSSDPDRLLAELREAGVCAGYVMSDEASTLVQYGADVVGEERERADQIVSAHAGETAERRSTAGNFGRKGEV